MTRGEGDIWFPAKKYGWGWGVPCAWQGWLALALYLVMLFGGGLAIDPGRQTGLFLAWVFGWTLALGIVCWVKGERPRWSWGARR